MDKVYVTSFFVFFSNQIYGHYLFFPRVGLGHL